MRNGTQGSGFGLIEILVTLGVIAVGSVGVTVFQAALLRQGADDRARTEARLLAQARLDEMRAQVASLPTPDAFATALPATPGFAHATAFAGTNTQFTRSERIDDTGRLKMMTVRVEWTDPAGDLQSLSLATQLGYTAPQRIGAVARTIAEPGLPSPGGSARIGTGTTPDGTLLAMHDDGTVLYRSGNSLALAAGGRVVLLLPEACTASGTQCREFARIEGRVWIDRATQPALAPGTIGVVASGNAWCLRYYIDDGIAQPLTPDTLATHTTHGGDYTWFDYSCYVGRGWYGNVGITRPNGFGDTDIVCIGDPLSADPASGPKHSARRAYRGLLYRHDAGTASGREEMATADGTAVRLYSHGVAAGTTLPAPGDALHDFVIGAVDTEPGDAACIAQGIMMRPDAHIDGRDGALFAGMPAAFVCLNPYLDDYPTAQFRHDEVCPAVPAATE